MKILTKMAIVLLVALGLRADEYNFLNESFNFYSARAVGLGRSYAGLWEEELEASWINPAAAAFYGRGGKIGYSSNKFWMGFPDYSGSINGGFDLNDQFSIGLGSSLNYYDIPVTTLDDMDGDDPMISKGAYTSAFSGALGYFERISISLGVNYRYLSFYEHGIRNSNCVFDLGAIVEGEVFQDRDVNTFKLKKLDLSWNIVPGVYLAYRNIAKDFNPGLDYGVYVSSYIKNANSGRELINLSYNFNHTYEKISRGLECELYELITLFSGVLSLDTYPSPIISYGYGLEISQIISDIIKDHDKEIDLFDHIGMNYYISNFTTSRSSSSGERTGVTAASPFQYSFKTLSVHWKF